MSSPPFFHWIVEKAEVGERLDRFLTKKISSFSRSQLKHLIESKAATLNGRPAKASHLLRENEEIRLDMPAPRALQTKAQDLPLDILYEDIHLLVVNKPAEQIVHPGAGVKEGTLVNALLHHCRDLSGIGGVLRPGIVHRLDKGTSGVLVIAKNDLAHHSLSQQFHDRKVEKKYLAFVWGRLRHLQGIVDSPLGRNSGDRKKISSNSRHLREALTHYQVLKQWEEIALVELSPKTGRTHQIRVHLVELGHPILGDPVYGRGLRRMERLSAALQERVKAMPFQLLHSHSLKFTHPATGRLMSFVAPMRDEMKQMEMNLNKSEKQKKK